MKRLLLALTLFLGCFAAHAQDAPNYSTITLKEKSDYAKAEPTVLQATHYLLSTPPEKNNVNRLYAMQFLIKWMEGTPDFTFDIDETAVKLTKNNPDLLGVYLACATKYSIENKAQSKDKKQVKLNTLKELVRYTTSPVYNGKLSGELKKLIKANAEGKLEEYVG